MDFCLHCESIDHWKITPKFYNNFSDFFFGGGASPLPTLLTFPKILYRYFCAIFNTSGSYQGRQQRVARKLPPETETMLRNMSISEMTKELIEYQTARPGKFGEKG